MYNPNDNLHNEQNVNNTENTEAKQDRQDTAVPYTAQTNPGGAPAGQQPASGRPYTGVPGPDGTYHSGVNTPGYRPGTAGNYVPGPASAYGTPQQPQAQQPQRGAYTWNQQGQPQQPPYYAPVQPKQKKRGKKRGGRFAVKAAAAVLACAVVAFGSVGVFALMIQNGVVNIESTGAEKTAAFTIYKQADDDNDNSATAVVTGESLTAQQVAQKLIPSVVCVENYQVTQQSGYFFGYGYGNSGSDGDSGISPSGEGSGIIISSDGYIVTNQHVVDGATSLKVVTSEGLTYEAELVGEDTQTDLAVIKVTTDDELTPAEFGSSDDLQVADEVMAVGNPGGLQFNSSVTFGHVSALNRQVTNSDTGYTMACIQTDAAINPGNSGGALVDMNGHVVGINSSKIVATGYEGLGFAIPSDTVQPIVSDLMEYGYVKDRPMLGISGQYIDRLTASFYGMSAGYYVTSLNSGEAQQSGLQRGDMITAIDDTQVTSDSTISAYIANLKPGDTVTLTVERSGRTGTVQVVLSENTGKSGNG